MKLKLINGEFLSKKILKDQNFSPEPIRKWQNNDVKLANVSIS